MGTSVIQLPEVQEFLLDGGIYRRLEDIARTHGLPVDRSEGFLDFTDAITEGSKQINELPTLIQEAFSVDETKAKAVACDVAGFRLLPLEPVLPGVADAIAAWGGDIAAYPKDRVQKHEQKPATIAGTVLEQRGVSLPESLMQRYEFLSGEFLRGDQDEVWLDTFFQRNVGIGGLGLSKEASENLLHALKEAQTSAYKGTTEAPAPAEIPPTKDELAEMFRSLRTVAPKLKKPPIERQLPARPVKTEEVYVPSKYDLVTMLKELHADTVATASKAKKSVVKAAVRMNIGSSLISDEEAAEVEAHRVEDVPAPKDLPEDILAPIWPLFRKKRKTKQEFYGLVRTFVQGIREERHVEALLRDRYVFSSQEVQTIMAAFKAVKRRSEQVPQTLDHGTAKVTEKDSKEQDVLNRRYAALTKRASSDVVEPVLPGARVSAARTKEGELALQAKNVPEELVIEAEKNSRPAPVRPKLSRESVPPKDGSGRLTDVKFTPRLVGPVDELGTMEPDDFRRLSSNPEEAARKIEASLDTLAETSAELHVQGIQAWRKSPINTLYQEMVHEALASGVAIAEVATSRRNKGLESLSPKEIQALVDVNAYAEF